MRPSLFFAAALGSVLISQQSGAQSTSGASAPAAPTAPLGHAQPRGPNYTPGSEADKAEQQRLNTEQQQQNRRSDQDIDQRLKICRGC